MSTNTSTDIDLVHLCRLAQLALNEDELHAAQADLARIIGMVNQMQAMDTDGVAPLTHPLEKAQRLRPDSVTEQVDREQFQSIAPATEGGLYLVPRVIE